MKRYKKYKDSGVEWIGEIPEEWEVCKLKHLIDIKDGTHDTPLYVEISKDSIPLITSKDIKNGNIELDNANHISYKDYLLINKRSNVEKNDVIMPMIGTVGNPAIVKIDDKFSIKNIALFKTNHNIKLSKYMYYLIESDVVKKQFNLMNRGGVQSFVSLSILNDLKVTMIPMSELDYIVDYLDHKTSQLEALISKKQELIETLKASRTKLISETVTKGLNKDVEMKDSGVEWIGEIPKEWEVCKLKYLFDVVGGGTPSSTDESYWDGEIKWITPKDINESMYILDSERTITKKGLRNSSAKLIKRDSILITTRAPIGNMCINKYDSTTNQGCHSLVNVHNNNIKYYYYYFNSIKNILIANGKGTTFLELSKQALENIYTFEIPLHEQQAIATYLDHKTSQIDNLISKIEKQIILLKKAKEKLITEVVTGKINITDL